MKNFKNLTEKQTLTFTIIGAIVACLVPFFILSYFQYESGNGITSQLLTNPENLTSQLNDLEGKLTSMKQTIGTKAKLEKEKENLNEIYNRAKKALPETEDKEGLIKLLGEIFDRSRLKLVHLKDISPKPRTVRKKKKKGPKIPPVRYIRIKYTLEGNYQDILNFIHQVEDHDFERFIMITELKLEPKVDIEKDDNLEYMRAVIEFTSFYYSSKSKKKGSAK